MKNFLITLFVLLALSAAWYVVDQNFLPASDDDGIVNVPVVSSDTPEPTEAETEVAGTVTRLPEPLPETFDVPILRSIMVTDNAGEAVAVIYAVTPTGYHTPNNPRIALHSQLGVGSYLKARGTFDAEHRVLAVSESSHYLETFPEKPAG